MRWLQVWLEINKGLAGAGEDVEGFSGCTFECFRGLSSSAPCLSVGFILGGVHLVRAQVDGCTTTWQQPGACILRALQHCL